MIVARDAERILLDTSVFVTFVEAEALFPLAQHLPNAAVALDVQIELNRLAAGRVPALGGLEWLGWPAGDAMPLPTQLLADAEAIRRLEQRPGEHEDANRGEIATALLAASLGLPVVLDDHLGKRLCQFRNVPRLSTAQLAAEMVATEAVDEAAGLAVFEIATPDGIGELEFRDSLTKARALLDA